MPISSSRYVGYSENEKYSPSLDLKISTYIQGEATIATDVMRPGVFFVFADKAINRSALFHTHTALRGMYARQITARKPVI